MKKLFVSIVIILNGVLFNSCVKQKEHDALKERNEELYEIVLSLGLEKAKLEEEIKAFKVLTEEKVKIEDFNNQISVVAVEKKSNREESEVMRIELSFKLTNNSNKDIRGIQGVMDIQDMFGVSIKKFKYAFTDDLINAGKSVINDSLVFKANQFMGGDLKLYNEKLKNLNFLYTPTKIVFTDGSIAENN